MKMSFGWRLKPHLWATPQSPPARAKRILKPCRGQALVEFALILPVFIGMMFGLAELSLVYGTVALYSTAADQAARYVALSANRGNAVDQQTAQGVLQMVQPYFVAHVTRIEIYQSDAQGGGPQAGAENSYDGTGAAQSQTWPVASRISTVAQPRYAGVRITYSYTWLTAFIGATGTSLTLQANAVVPIAPLGG